MILPLASVLTIRDDEIKPRHDIREIFGEAFSEHAQEITYLGYLQICKRREIEPSDDEWRKIQFLLGHEISGDNF